mmetsp:Transcript_63128/g.113620  ORF Transcript_63128/g.113620 Transcript_63128/m.113620 type:complete len:158 (-) Transcript_63128:60-533(-)
MGRSSRAERSPFPFPPRMTTGLPLAAEAETAERVAEAKARANQEVTVGTNAARTEEAMEIVGIRDGRSANRRAELSSALNDPGWSSNLAASQCLASQGIARKHRSLRGDRTRLEVKVLRRPVTGLKVHGQMPTATGGAEPLTELQSAGAVAALPAVP